MAATKFCSECGTALKENAKFCPSCGTAVAVAAAVVIDEYTVVLPPEDKQPAAAQQPQVQQPPQQKPQIEDDLDLTVVQPRPPIIQPTKQQQQQKPPPQYSQPQQPYQQPYQQRPAQQYVPAQKKKAPVALILILVFVVVIAVIGVGVFLIYKVASGALKSTAETDFFEISGDKIPSVKYILGEERSVKGVSSSASNGIEEKVITYNVSENQNEDMYEYAMALINNYGYVNITDYDFTGSTGANFQFAANSSKEGYIIIVYITYDTGGYTLTIQRGKGELTY